MCFINVIVLVTLLAACESARFDDDIGCTPGTTTKVGCSTCFCVAPGWELCTGVCPRPEPDLDTESEEDDSYKSPQKPLPYHREPGTYHHNRGSLEKLHDTCRVGEVTGGGCNKCYCIAPGWQVCTGLCPTPEPEDEYDSGQTTLSITQIIVTEDASECKIGETSEGGCNKCFCMAPGWLVCTGFCPDSEAELLFRSQLAERKLAWEMREAHDLKLINLTNSSKCKVGEVIQRDCYECVCLTPNQLSCANKNCLRRRPMMDLPYQPTPVPNSIEVRYKKLGFGSGQCPVGQIITTSNCSTCTCVLKGILVCSKQTCDKSKQDPVQKLSYNKRSTGMPILEYEPEYYDIED